MDCSSLNGEWTIGVGGQKPSPGEADGWATCRTRGLQKRKKKEEKKGTVKLSSMRASRQAPIQPSEPEPELSHHLFIHEAKIHTELHPEPSTLFLILFTKILPRLHEPEPVPHPNLSLVPPQLCSSFASYFQHAFPVRSGLQHLTPSARSQNRTDSSAALYPSD